MRRRVLALALACAAVSSGAGTAWGAPPPLSASAPPDGVQAVARGGFGDYRNSYSWAMAWFKGRLYVGTARQQACFENLTIDFYLPVLEQYKTSKFPGVTCPKDPWDMDLRAEIWRYDPRSKRWLRVFRSPKIPNPAERGKTVGRDIAFRGMRVYRDARGREALYAAGVTANEVLPQNKRRYPPRLLMTTDGRHFRSIPAGGTILRNPFGTVRPIGMRSLKVWHDRLYVTLTGGLTGDGEVYEVTRPWGPNARFKQITPKSMMVFEIERFHGALYAGTGDRDTGYGVYKTTSRHAPYKWTPVVTGGAGRGAKLTSVVSMHPYRGRLYVGSSGWYNGDSPNSELISIDPSGDWDVVVGATRVADGILKAPVSGMGDGFNSLFAAHFWRMGSEDGALYLGTNDWSWILELSEGAYPELRQLVGWDYGFDLWGTCNGSDWWPVTRNAFDDGLYNFGARNIVSSPFGLFVGSANHAQGTSVWLDRRRPCAPGGTGRTTAALATPERTFAAVHRDGNLLSWAGVAGARSYRLLRAEQRTVSVSVDAPPVLPNGFRPESAVPVPVPPGTPGAATVSGTTLGPFEAIGTTGSRHFVDRSRDPGRTYAYRVVALGAPGDSSPSGVVFAPDLRPPATWAGLERELARAPVTRRLSAAAASVRGSGGRRERALLTRVRRSAPPGSRLEDLAVRLARQSRYRDLAGGPA